MQQPAQPETEATHSVAIRAESDIVMVRKVARDAAEAVGFDSTDVTRIVTAASELARNVFNYAGSGIMRWHRLNAGGAPGIELKFKDNGPGIADIGQAMEAGYSTSGGLGLGLPGVKRLMDEMEIKSQVGKGTVVKVRKWLKR
jgi:serine/threonine-protein kinase RsbT